jgi:hypothetical protein
VSSQQCRCTWKSTSLQPLESACALAMHF